jgi:CTP:phosphocholine cytidylyltransferase-like protein
MGKSKLTWKFYSARRKGLTVEKYVEINDIKSLVELQESLRQKDVQLPDPELLKDMFKPPWTGQYTSAGEENLADKTQAKESSNAKTNKTNSRKKNSKKRVEKKSTYLQAAYETGSQDDDPDAEPGA